MTRLVKCLVAFGSNLGDGAQILKQALDLISRNSFTVAAVSSLYRTKPVGGPIGQGEFTNAVFAAETSLLPDGVVELLLHVEAQLGRERRVRWGSRRIDLDLLLYDDVIESTARCRIPHPRMSHRRFVLEPACDVAPRWVHPIVGISLQQLLELIDVRQNIAALLTTDSIQQCADLWRGAQAARFPVRVLPLDALRRDERGLAGGWTLAVTDSLGRLAAHAEQIKLLVFPGRWDEWAASPHDLQRVFRGPILELDEPELPDAVRRELSAAIDAIT